MKAFTDKYIQSLKPEAKPYYVREGRGFAVRVLPTGLRTFFYIYTLEGKRQHHKLGHYPEMSLAEAREQYSVCYTAVTKGLPLAVPVEPVAPAPSLTFKEMADRYIKVSESRLSAETWDKTQRVLRKDVFPYWANIPITELKRRAVIELLERVAERAPGSTANVHKAIRSVFEYALDREYIEFNPSIRLTKAVPELKRKARTRALSPEEIKTVWNNMGTRDAQRILKLILLTAQRPSEVIYMETSEINGHVWTIPEGRMKSGRGAHMVYLTDTALEIIGDVKEGRIFHVERNTVSIEVQKFNCFGIEHFTPHDLRRTARTHMARLRIPEEHSEAILSHAKQGMVGVYNQYEYWEEKRAALIEWEKELLRLTK